MDERRLRLVLRGRVGEDDYLAQLEQLGVVLALPVPLGRDDPLRVVLGVFAEREDRAGRAAVAARAGDPVEDVGVGAAVQVDDGERRECRRAQRAASGSSTRRISASRCASILALRKRVDRVEHDERELVLDHDLLEKLVLVRDRDPSCDGPGTIKAAKTANNRLGVLTGWLAFLTARIAFNPQEELGGLGGLEARVPTSDSSAAAAISLALTIVSTGSSAAISSVRAGWPK